MYICTVKGDMQGPCNQEEVSIKGVCINTQDIANGQREEAKTIDLLSWRTRNLELICDRQLEGN